MTNREKFAEQIMDIACSGDRIAVDKEAGKIVPCASLRCKKCLFDGASQNCMHAAHQWCYSESTDWSKVPVDTPILVRDCENDEWLRRYYAGLSSEGMVRAWAGGRTSWSACDGNRKYRTKWNYAKLAEDGDNS